MSYEVTTKLLIETVDAAREVIRGVQSGEMEMAAATRVLGAARVMQSAVAIDIRARLADPRIRSQEAKLIETQKSAQLPAA